jgi:hypothetical protein
MATWCRETASRKSQRVQVVVRTDATKMHNKSSKAFIKRTKISRKRELCYNCQKNNAYTLLANILLRRVLQVGQLTPIIREVVGAEFLVFTV